MGNLTSSQIPKFWKGKNLRFFLNSLDFVRSSRCGMTFVYQAVPWVFKENLIAYGRSLMDVCIILQLF